MHDNPDSVANTAIRSIIYGSDSQYGHPALGFEETISNLNVENVREHYEQFIKSNENVSFLIVGDINKSKSQNAIAKSFDRISVSSSNSITDNLNISNQNLPSTKHTIYLIDNPGAAQSIIRVGSKTVSRNNNDYNNISLFNYILGGDYSSRLNLNLRQDKGYSYGFYSSIIWHNNPSLWVCRGSVQTEVTKESIVEILKEISQIKEVNPISKPEFENAKQSILKGMASQFETNNQLMSQLINISTYNLPVDYYKQRISNISQLKHNMIIDAGEKYLNDNRLSIVIVGDVEKIEPDLQKLNIRIIHSDQYGNKI